ncbi:MAG: cytochrome c biogenesis protein CcsA [Planctomycetota bacterium]
MGRFKFRWVDLFVVLVLVYYGWSMSASRPKALKAQTDESAFATALDLSPLYETAVQGEGRLRSFESHAQSLLSLISGSKLIDGQTFGFTYLDLIFVPESYTGREVIYVKNKLVRARIADALYAGESITTEDRQRIIKKGLVTPRQLQQPRVMQLRRELSEDLIRTARDAQAIQTALAVSNPNYLRSILQMVAPEGATELSQWISVDDIALPPGAPSDAAHAALTGQIEGLSDENRQKIAGAWGELSASWRARDAQKTNAAIAAFANTVKSVSADAYPSTGRLKWEGWYFRSNSMTWVWLIYLASVLPLLMSLVYKWDRARVIGMTMFFVAFGFHTASLILRWYISGRWPNSNMFEAVTTAAWFGGVGAIILEWFTRATPLRNLFALGSAVMSMVALMACHFMPAEIDSSIRNKMAALNDIWLYIHTNVIIWSYAVIGIACVPALLLLRHRWCECWDKQLIPKWRLFILPVALVLLNEAVWKLMMSVINTERFGLTSTQAIIYSAMFAGAMGIVLLELMAARDRARAGIRVERSASGGAATVMAMGGGGALGGGAIGGGASGGEKPSTGQVLDGATMVLVEVAFIMLWAGTVMGAIWADHSWGRPWGWDPKEVFALNTFIIFVLLIHVRFKVRDKAFWTAILAVVGFAVMLFNWIVVNFVITGLHSYA